MEDDYEAVEAFVQDYDSSKCYDVKYAAGVFDFAQEHEIDEIVDDSDPNAVEHRILAGNYLFRFATDEHGVIDHVIDIKKDGVL